MFVPYSRNRDKAERVREAVRDSKENIRVVETPGVSLKRMFQRSDPSRPTTCDDGRCGVCGGEEGERGGNCRQEGVVYMATCVICKEREMRKVYHGQTGRCLNIRAKEHLDDVRRVTTGTGIVKESTSGLAKHAVDLHRGEVPRFSFKVTRAFPGDPLSRQVAEGVMIEEETPESSLNSKQEWRPPETRNVVMRK